ncbi:MAG TPA: S1C family serine protease [Opitutaceae bacterium]|nr:S1C family serine protease [Opitutaceae bacterium]
MNRSRFLLTALAMLTAGALCNVRAASDADATAGRNLVKRYADAIVSVELVLTMKMKFGDREQPPREQRIEVNGTVISPNGLTITSLAEVDPQATIEAMRGGATGGRGRSEIVGSEFKEVKLRLADGREVPARFVMKDADLDLAFMAPEASAENAPKEFPFVKLEDATEGAVLGTYFYVARAPKTLQRVPLVRATEIIGLVEKPRRMYLMGDQAVGTPIFNARGAVLGITVRYFANGRESGYVVLPSEDIAEMAKQAKAAQAR